MSEQRYKETKQKLLSELDYYIATHQPSSLIYSVLEDLAFLRLLRPGTDQLEMQNIYLTK